MLSPKWIRRWLKQALSAAALGSLLILVQCTNAPERVSSKKKDAGPADSDSKPGDDADGDGEPDTLPPTKISDLNEDTQNKVFLGIVNKAATASTCASDISSKPSIRILTRVEYKASVESSLGIKLDAAVIDSVLPVETPKLGYDHLRDFNVFSPERIESYINSNEIVAKQFVKDKGESVLKCNSGAAKACFETWLTNALPVLWRTEVSAADIATHGTQFMTYGGNAEALQVMVERLLLSYQFLYRRSIGEEGQLSSWEVASALSDTLWAAPVSTELAALAKGNKLQSKADIQAQIALMIKDKRFYEGVKRFVDSWLGTQALKTKSFMAENAKVDAAVRSELLNETADFFYYLVRNDSDTMKGIFTSNFSVGTDVVAQAYGLQTEAIPAAALGGMNAQKKKIIHPADTAAGILSQPSQIISMSNPDSSGVSKRGKEILSHFMCNLLITPPNLNTIVAMTKFDTNLSKVEAIKAVTDRPGCAECHKVIDGIGGGLEGFGSAGLQRTMDDHKKAISGAGELFSVNGKSLGTFTTPATMGALMAGNKEIELCMVVQAFRMVYGRLEREEDSCTIVNAHKAASEGSFKFNKVLSSLLSESSFLQRKKAGDK